MRFLYYPSYCPLIQVHREHKDIHTTRTHLHKNRLGSFKDACHANFLGMQRLKKPNKRVSIPRSIA